MNRHTGLKKKTGKYVSADFRVLVLSVWDWLSSIQSTSFLIFNIKKRGWHHHIPDWAGSNPPLPLYPFCFPCRTLWPRAKHLLSVVKMHQRKLAEVGAEKLSGQTKNLDADAAKCANIADMFAAVDVKQQTGWRRRGGWAVESTTGKLGKRQRAAWCLFPSWEIRIQGVHVRMWERHGHQN